MKTIDINFDPKATAQTFDAAREAWQSGLTMWSENLVQTSQKNLDMALSLREQYGKLFGQAMDRSQAIAGQEQALFGQLSELVQHQTKTQMEMASKLSGSLMEAGRGWQQQAQAAQTQISELVGQTAEMAVNTVEETTARANGASRARTR